MSQLNCAGVNIVGRTFINNRLKASGGNVSQTIFLITLLAIISCLFLILRAAYFYPAFCPTFYPPTILVFPCPTFHLRVPKDKQTNRAHEDSPGIALPCRHDDPALPLSPLLQHAINHGFAGIGRILGTCVGDRWHDPVTGQHLGDKCAWRE